MIGGGDFEFNTIQQDMWGYDGFWHLLDASPTPVARYSAQFVYNSHDGTLYLFGGDGNPCDNPPAAECNTVWQLSGMTWSNVGTSPEGFSERGYFDPVRSRTLHFGPDIFEWGGTFSEVTPPNPQNESRPQSGVISAAYSLTTNHGIVSDDSGLWSWDSGATSAPGHLATFSMRNAGPEGMGATLTGISITWFAAASSTAVEERQVLLLKERQSVLPANPVFGGTTAAVHDLGRLSGRTINTRWTLLVDDCCAGNTTTLERWCVVGRDTNNNLVGPFCDETDHILANATLNRFTQDLSLLAPTTLSDVDISLQLNPASGSELTIALDTDTASGLALAGAELLVWNGSEFVEIDNNVATSSTTDRTLWSLNYNSISSELPKIISGANRDLLIAVTPRGKNGKSYAEIATDYVEATFYYDAP